MLPTPFRKKSILALCSFENIGYNSIIVCNQYLKIGTFPHISKVQNKKGQIPHSEINFIFHYKLLFGDFIILSFDI